MRDPEMAVAAGLGIFTLVFAMLLSFVGMASDRMRYEAFLSAQSNALACRADNTKDADKICGPVPQYKDFKNE
jgi:hypothetical protein